MILLQSLVICFLPLVLPISIVTRDPTNVTKQLLSDDLPEDYHAATIATDVESHETSGSNGVVTAKQQPETVRTTVTEAPVDENIIVKNESSTLVPVDLENNVHIVDSNLTESIKFIPVSTNLSTPVDVNVANVTEEQPKEDVIERRVSTIGDFDDEATESTLARSSTEQPVTKSVVKKVLVSRPKSTTLQSLSKDATTEIFNNTRYLEIDFNGTRKITTESPHEEFNVTNNITKLKPTSFNTTVSSRGDEAEERMMNLSETASSFRTTTSNPKLTTIPNTKPITTTTATTTTTTISSKPATTLVINNQFFNNGLNVIDSSLRPVVEDVTETFLSPGSTRNTINFSNSEYGSSSQTDWIPLTPTRTLKASSKQPLRSTEPPRTAFSDTSTAEITTIRAPRSTTLDTPESVISDFNKLSNFTETVINTKDPDTATETGDLNLPIEGVTWALATSIMTRKPQKTTEHPITNDITYAEPGNVSQDATSMVDLTSSKEHNQVLKNTIPDSNNGESSSTESKWKPVFTVVPPVVSTKDSKMPSNSSSHGTTQAPSTDKLELTEIPSNLSAPTEDYTDLETTVSLEIMKITTASPELKTVLVPEKVTERNTTLKDAAPHAVEHGTVPSGTTETPIPAGIVANSTERVIEQTSGKVNVENTGSLDSSKIIPMTTIKPESSKRPSTTTETMLSNVTESSKTSMPSTATPFVAPVMLSETTIFDVPTTREVEPVTVVDNTTAKPEKTDDDNRTNILNETIIFDDSTDEPAIDEITEENVPAYLRLTVQTSELQLCHLLPELRSAILKMLSDGTQSNVSSDLLVFLNLNPTICHPVLSKNRPDDAEVRLRPVNMFLMDSEGDFNKNLSESFLTLWGHAGLDFPLPILKVDFVTPIVEGEMPGGVGGGVVAAIVISCVAGICLILLGILFVIVKRRQKKFNYGQRCTPVSLDAYSLDSVSIRNSSRRKGIRASKMSYGNAAFDDPDIPSHELNFSGLANFSGEKDQIHQEFSVIPQVSPRAEELPPGVETRNRYANVLPLPETRVILPQRDGDPLSDYINANYVRGLNGIEKTYIAAQAPLASTLAEWWRMVWENQVKVMLMVTALQENGVEKCADYLPPNEVTDNLRLFGDFQIILKKRDVKEKYIVSTLQLKNMETNLWREVKHLWYLGWPETGVPGEPNSLIAFLIEARSQLKTSSGVTTPTLVHCSPGTGRTGTVIACDLCIREFEQKRLVDIPRCVYHLRRARAGAVQTREQYAFIYQVLNTYATKLTGGVLENI